MAKKAGPKKGWVYSAPTPSKSKVPEDVKAEVQRQAEALVSSHLKPRFVKEPPEDTEWNYIVDMHTKWYRSYFYFCSKYRAPSPHAISEYFEEKFARLEYAENGRFNLAYMRHTDQWWEIAQGLTLEECLGMIREDPLFQP